MPTTIHRFNQFTHSIKAVLIALFLLLSLFFVSRFAFLLFLSQAEILTYDLYQLSYAFMVGFRFDLRVAIILFLPFFLLASWGKINKQFLNSLKIYSLVVLASVLFLNISDYFYFQFYQSHFNGIIFGLIEDDFVALMQTIWAQYPLITTISSIILFIPLSWFLLGKFININKINTKQYHIIHKIIFVIVLLFLIVYGARGGFAMHPLGSQDKIVSDNQFINQLGTNSVIELYETIVKRAHIFDNINPKSILDKYNYSHISQPLSDYFGIQFDKNISDKEAFESLFIKTTAKKDNKKNVIFALMESQSGHLSDYHSNKNNLLGELSIHFKKDIVFNRFLSSEHGTNPSLENILLNTPIYPIGQSRYKNINFKSNIITPFKKNGYEIIFITGGSNGWRDLDKFLPKQGFDKIIDKISIKNKYPQATENTWGVFDEYLFDYTYDLIQNNKSKKPLFIFLLSTGHHPPYKIPPDYKLKKYQIPAEFDDILFDKSKKEAHRVLKSYQYSNDKLGLFISKIKNNNDLKNKTIIATTGDHNTRDIIKYNSNRSIFNHVRVPFYLYLPDDLKQNIKYDNNIIASHKDIFPTIYNRIFKDTKYFKSGEDLLAVDKSNNFAIHNCLISANKYGAIKNTAKPFFYKWHKKTLLKSAKLNNNLQKLLKKTQAYCAIMHWQILYQTINE
ncbi:MAG: hypothetical protein DRQ51_02440 [Gammaproteobacteria bacterium]|nr:MAG: hypothetical protein DRQ51_02440 [Gammaproteobacteria bacterium]